MAPFRAELGWIRMRKGESKNHSFVPFLPDANWKFEKNCKKILKIE